MSDDPLTKMLDELRDEEAAVAPAEAKYDNSHPALLIRTDCEPGELPTAEEVERHYVLHVLRRVGGNKARAARLLRIDRRTLYRKLARWEAVRD